MSMEQVLNVLTESPRTGLEKRGFMRLVSLMACPPHNVSRFFTWVYLKTKRDSEEVGTKRLVTDLAFWQFLEAAVNNDLNSMGVENRRLGYDEEEFVFDALLPMLDSVLESFFDPVLFPESLVLFRRMVPVIWIFIARITPTLRSAFQLKMCASVMIRFDSLLPQAVPPRVFVGIQEALTAVTSGLLMDAELQRSLRSVSLRNFLIVSTAITRSTLSRLSSTECFNAS